LKKLRKRGGVNMTNCPICNTKLKEDRRELLKGVFAKVEVCPKCEEEWVSGGEHDRMMNLFKRRAFLTGGSLAVRLPQEIAQALNIKDGSELSFKVAKNKVIIEPS